MMIIIALSNKNTVLSKEPVKKAANYITLSNEEDGVAEAIDKFCSQQ